MSGGERAFPTRQLGVFLSAAQLQRIAAQVRDFSGICRPRDTSRTVVQAVASRMFTLGLDEVQQYIELVEGASGRREVEELVQLLTISKTSFFRDRRQFELLEQDILPRLLRGRSGGQLLRGRSGGQPLRIWSAGCSTGEEAYSLAIAVRRRAPDFPAQILASDISRESLDRARDAGYRDGDLDFLDSEQRRWFVREGQMWRPLAEIRAMVEFVPHNLMTLPYPQRGGPWDVIFCRNVLIYFSRETVCLVLDRFYQVLAEEGYLFLGSSESLFGLDDRFQVESSAEAMVYRKPLTGHAKQTPARKIRPAAANTSGRQDKPAPAPLPQETARQPHLLEAAHRLLGKGKTQEAFSLLFDLTTRQPQLVEPYLLLSKLAADRGQLEEAISWQHAAVEIGPMEIEPRFVLAIMLQRAGYPEQALHHLRRILYLDKNFYPAHYYLGVLASHLGDLDLAVRSWRCALETASRPDSPELEAFCRNHRLGKKELIAASRALLDRAGWERK